MKRIKAGWELTKKSWAIIRSHPGLIKLPIMGSILALLCLIIIGVPGAILAAGNSSAEQVSGGALLILASYISSYFVIYYNVALAAATNIIFSSTEEDVETCVSNGLEIAKQRRGVIAKWALLALFVSIIFNLLRQRGGLIGQIAAGLGAAIWSLVTFLIAPVLAMEGLGPIEAIKRSTSMFKQKWGEQITGNIAISAIMIIPILTSVILMILGIVMIAAGSSGLIAGVLLIIIAVLLMVTTIFVSTAARGVFGVALYRYITHGEASGSFTIDELEGAVKQAN